MSFKLDPSTHQGGHDYVRLGGVDSLSNGGQLDGGNGCERRGAKADTRREEVRPSSEPARQGAEFGHERRHTCLDISEHRSDIPELAGSPQFLQPAGALVGAPL